MELKPVEWLGDSRKRLREAHKSIRYRAGLELRALQTGNEPSDWKPMTSVGPGVIEIRLTVGSEYRIFTIAKLEDAIYVIHVFVKKTRKTPNSELEIARKRYRALKEELR